MSFSQAIGQVDQIVQWEQQLADPAALAQSSGTAADGTTSNPSSGVTPGGASFSAALAQAQTPGAPNALSTLTSAVGQGSGVPMGSPADLLSGGDGALLSALQSTAPTAGATGPGAASANMGTTGVSPNGGFTGSAASVDDPRIQSMIQEADSLIGKPYIWGGGHGNFGPQAGYDCSGFVSAVLHAGGYLTSPQDTETLPSARGIESGPGQYVTLYDRTTPGQQGHVIMEINGQFYESGGAQGAWGGGGGVQKISTPSAAYLSTFNLILHPAGL